MSLPRALRYDRDWNEFLAALPTEAAHDLTQRLASTYGPDTVADDALYELLCEAAAGSIPAARLILRRLLPPIQMIAARRSRQGCGRTLDLVDELVSTTWILIRCYPVSRSPRHIASRIASEAEYAVFVRPLRLNSAREYPATVLPEPTSPVRNPGDEVLELLRIGQAAHLDPDDLRLVGQLALGSESVSQTAERLGCTSRTILNRRRTVERSLLRAAG